MQSICALLPDELATQVSKARAVLASEPTIGEIYDPPFAHFTLQLAEDYDWDALAARLGEFASEEQPFEAKTSGLLLFTNGKTSDVAIAPYLDEKLRAFQERFWKAIDGLAIGNVRKMDYPGSFLPHITIKRCGSDHHATGRALSNLLGDVFNWTFTVDNVAVQHDPGMNSRTHYLRLKFPLGGQPATAIKPGQTNATITGLRVVKGANGESKTLASVRLDAGGEMEHTWSAAELVLPMAELQCSDVHFPGSRCQVENGGIISIEPKTPYPRVH